VVAVGLPDRVIHIEIDPLVGAGQDRRHRREAGQQPGGDRIQLAHVPEPVAAQVGAQGGRGPQTGEDPPHAAVAEHVQVTDAVRAHDHPGDDRGHLGRRVRAGGSRHRHVRVDQLVQAGLLGHLHHRRQTTERDQVRVIEHRLQAVGN